MKAPTCVVLWVSSRGWAWVRYSSRSRFWPTGVPRCFQIQEALLLPNEIYSAAVVAVMNLGVPGTTWNTFQETHSPSDTPSYLLLPNIAAQPQFIQLTLGYLLLLFRRVLREKRTSWRPPRKTKVIRRYHVRWRCKSMSWIGRTTHPYGTTWSTGRSTYERTSRSGQRSCR